MRILPNKILHISHLKTTKHNKSLIFMKKEMELFFYSFAFDFLAIIYICETKRKYNETVFHHHDHHDHFHYGWMYRAEQKES